MTKPEGTDGEPEPCEDCNGSRSVPDLGEYEDGYGPCPSCVIDAGDTFVIWDPAAT